MSAELRDCIELDTPIQRMFGGKELTVLKRSPILKGEGVKHGNGEAVLVFPGWNEGDADMMHLANFLRIIGYDPILSGLSYNFGGFFDFTTALKLSNEVARKRGEHKIVGHSLGGKWGTDIATRQPMVKSVVAIGAPMMNLVPTDSISASIFNLQSPGDKLLRNTHSYLQENDHAQNLIVEDPTHIGLIVSEPTYIEVARVLSVI